MIFGCSLGVCEVLAWICMAKAVDNSSITYPITICRVCAAELDRERHRISVVLCSC